MEMEGKGDGEDEERGRKTKTIAWQGRLSRLLSVCLRRTPWIRTDREERLVLHLIRESPNGSEDTRVRFLADFTAFTVSTLTAKLQRRFFLYYIF